jgi:hypothetical protein
MATNFTLFVRAFAPFDTFGLLFHGDGATRRPTTSPCATARIHAWVGFNPLAGTIGQALARSHESTYRWARHGRTAQPQVKASAVKLSQGIFVQLDAWGANPLIPSPDVDVRVRIEAASVAGRLNLSASMSGDLFPNFEVFLEDEAGKRRMVQAFETSGGAVSGPSTRLWGNRQANMGGVCASFGVDEEGLFQ